MSQTGYVSSWSHSGVIFFFRQRDSNLTEECIGHTRPDAYAAHWEKILKANAEFYVQVMKYMQGGICLITRPKTLCDIFLKLICSNQTNTTKAKDWIPGVPSLNNKTNDGPRAQTIELQARVKRLNQTIPGGGSRPKPTHQHQLSAFETCFCNHL